MERRLLFIRQLVDCMAEFLDREVIEIPDDCYSEEYSDDDNFIDDTEDVEDEEYNELVQEIKDTLEKQFDTPIKAAYRKEIKERVEKKMEEIAEEGYKNLKEYRKKKEEKQDDTHFSDEEKAREKPKSKKRPISKEVVSSDDDDDTDDNHEPSTSAPKKKKKKTNEEEEMELTNAAALNSDEEPAIYGNSDNDGEQDSSEEEVDVTDPEKGFGKCCLCKSELRGGAGKKNDAPWVQCLQKEVCKFTWMDYGTALEFHKIVKRSYPPSFAILSSTVGLDANAVP